MKNEWLIAGGAILSVALLAPSARAWQVAAEEHDKHHPEAQTTAPKAPPPAEPQAKSPAAMNMMASNAKLDELVKKMNAARGEARVDAMAELLTALVQNHQTMHGNMSNMMRNMGGRRGK